MIGVFARSVGVVMVAAVVLAWSGQAPGAAKKPATTAYLTPAEAGPDYGVQGEYEGAAGGKKIGVQVIALGKGAFQAVFYPGGLPGAGWDAKVRYPVDGKTEGDKTVFAACKGRKTYLGNSPAEFSALKPPPPRGRRTTP